MVLANACPSAEKLPSDRRVVFHKPCLSLCWLIGINNARIFSLLTTLRTKNSVAVE